MMDFVLEMLDFVLEMMDFVLEMLDFFRIRRSPASISRRIAIGSCP